MQAISNQQIYFYIFLLSIMYVIPNLKYKSLNFYFFHKKSNFYKNKNEILSFLVYNIVE